MTENPLKYREYIAPSELRSSPTMSAKKGVVLKGKVDLTIGDIFEKPKPKEIAEWESELISKAKEFPNDKKYHMDNNIYGYAGSLGTDGLLAAAAFKFSEDSGIAVESKNIAVGTGAKGALNAVASKFKAGDVVFMASPGWPTNFDIFPAGVKIIEVDTNGRGLIDHQQLEQLFDKYPEAKGMLINSPSNPTGEVYSAVEREELMGVIKGKAPKDFLAILDNPYGKIVYGGEPPLRGDIEKQLFESGNIAEVRSMSKEYGMAGLRVGYAVSKNENIIAQVGKWNESKGGLTAITQNLAQATLMEGDEYIKRNVEDLREKRKAMIDGIKELEGFASMKEPKGAIYGWVDFTGLANRMLKDTTTTIGSTPDGVKNFLINEAKIVGISGKPFYAPEQDESKALDAANTDNHFRLCFSSSLGKIQEAMVNLKAAIKKHVAGADVAIKRSEQRSPNER